MKTVCLILALALVAQTYQAEAKNFCDVNCKTCTAEGGCTTCYDGWYLNARTNMCTTCGNCTCTAVRPDAVTSSEIYDCNVCNPGYTKRTVSKKVNERALNTLTTTELVKTVISCVSSFG